MQFLAFASSRVRVCGNLGHGREGGRGGMGGTEGVKGGTRGRGMCGGREGGRGPAQLQLPARVG